jgi:transcriptional regulator with XRE-family HTH domain
MQALSLKPQTAVYDGDMAKGRPTSKPRSEFGERLAAARERAGLTQQQLADKIGSNQKVIAYWERNDVALRADQINAVAAALNTSAAELLNGSESKARGTGPAGRAKLMFETVSKLPRKQQQKILDVVQALVAQHQAG